MSTPCEIILFCKTGQKAEQTSKAILYEAKRLEKKYNYYDTNSLLSKINLRQENKLDLETKTLLQRAKQYYKLTENIFDITIATIKDIYVDEKSIENLEQKKANLLKYVGCEHFEIKKNKLYFDNTYTKIDLGGFVKEYSVDRAVNIIKKHKIQSALINFGGDIFVIGKKPNGEKFKIGIKNPIDKTKYIKFIELENEALTTSASYERFYEIENQQFSHILSKTNTLNAKSVTVISKNCVESGVFSTSLMINPKLKTKNRVIIF